MKRILIPIFILVISSAFPSGVHAQWNLVASNLIDNGNDRYFGIIYASGNTIWAGKNSLWMSPDTGKTWSDRSPFMAAKECIVSIHFFDDNNGIIGTTEEANSYSGNVYLTRDRGLSWKLIKKDINASSLLAGLCFAGSANDIIAANGDDGTISTSHDGGQTWKDVTITISSVSNRSYTLCMCALPNGNACALCGAYSPGSMHLEMTTDKGESWVEMPGTIDPDCFSIVASPCDENTLFAANEAAAFSNDLEADIFRTTDKGISWVSSATFPKEAICGSITASKDVLFIQSLDQVLRSTDGGVTWRNIGGPANGWDTRMICALDNNILFAVDSTGSIFRTFNSGGDSMTVSASNTSARFSSSRIINDSMHITIGLPIYFHHSGTMNDADMIVHYPTGSLTLAGTRLYNGRRFDVSGGQWAGRAALHFAAADLNGAPDSLLGVLNFLWTPYEAACDEILFDSIDMHNLESHCSSLIPEPFEGVIGSFQSCGLSGVARNEVSPTSLDFSIHPNPARTSVQIEIANSPGKIHYELFDELGISRRTGLASENNFTIDVSGLTEGNYYLRINRNSGEATTKIIVIIK